MNMIGMWLILIPGQTYEGGISGKPQSEAHGAYAFCVLACLCILGPPHETIPKLVASGPRCYQSLMHGTPGI